VPRGRLHALPAAGRAEPVQRVLRGAAVAERPRFPVRAAAALFLERQWLDRPRARRLTATSLERFAEATGGIQLDSINVVERAHYLTAWNRFGAYDRAALDRLVWKRRVLVDYWAHAACLVPASHLHAWRRAMHQYEVRHSGWGVWLKRHRPTLAKVEQAIRERGPLGSADFESARRRGDEQKGWWNWKSTTHALDFLWKSGRLAVHSRRHFHKRFDLAERVHGERLAEEPLAPEAFLRWHLRRAFAAMGAATDGDLRFYLSFPRLRPAERKATLAALLASGELVEVELDGARGRWWALAEDLDALARAARRRVPSRGTALLSPFDSFLWHRERTSKLYGFDYKIEVYTPGPARRYGYYTLPILHDGHLIGRLDPKTHRERGVLEVRSAHFEPWFARGAPPPHARDPLDRAAALGGVAGALQSLARFVGASRVELGRVVPRHLARALARHIESARVS
jgi:hypothetical protein